MALAEGVLPARAASALAASIWSIDGAEDAGRIARLTAPD
jgi:hypothetical protein